LPACVEIASQLSESSVSNWLIYHSLRLQSRTILTHNLGLHSLDYKFTTSKKSQI
jgi:hypothetical protein